MALSQVSGPTPFPAVQPFPPVQLPPYFGLSQNQQQQQAVIPSLGRTVPTLVSNPSPFESELQMRLMNQMTSGAVGANDPRTWTPADAQGQTDRALARIGAVNPQLAQTLGENIGRDTQPQTGGSFWSHLTHAVGDVFKLPGVSQVLNLVSRPAHIVPEILAGSGSFWDRIGHALSGNSTTGWGQVLDKYNIATGDGLFDRVLHAGLAFTGDLATDPLTYLLPGVGAVGREAVGKSLAEAAGHVGLAEGKDMAFEAFHGAVNKELVSQGEKELTRPEMWDQFMRHAFNMPLEHGKTAMDSLAEGGAALSDHFNEVARGLAVDKEAMGGVVNDVLTHADLTLTQERLVTMNDVYRQATTGGWKSARGALADKLGTNSKAVDQYLEAQVKAARFGTKAEYQQGKVAAAALGGPRFGFNFPPFGLRYISHRVIPYSMPFSDFSVARRFMSGLSGSTRLGKMVAEGEASIEDLHAWWDGAATEKMNAMSGLKAVNPKLAERMGNGFHGLGSMFYTASDSIGGLTAHFAGHAATTRGGGLGALAIADAARTARDIQQNMADEMLRVTATDRTVINGKSIPKDTPIPGPDAQELIFKRLGFTAERGRFQYGPGEAVANQDRINEWGPKIDEYNRLVGTPHADVEEHFTQQVKDFIELNKGHENKEWFNSELTQIHSEKEAALTLHNQLHAEFGDDGMEAIGWLGEQAHNVRTSGLENAVEGPHAGSRMDGATTVHSGDAARLTRTGHDSANGTVMQLRSEAPISPESGTLETVHIGDKHPDMGVARGYQLSRTRNLDDIPAAPHAEGDWSDLPEAELIPIDVLRSHADVFPRTAEHETTNWSADQHAAWWKRTVDKVRSRGFSKSPTEDGHIITLATLRGSPDGKLFVEDGNHTLAIAEELGMTHVPVRYVKTAEGGADAFVKPSEIPNSPFADAVQGGGHRATEFVADIKNPMTAASARQLEKEAREDLAKMGLANYDKSLDDLSKASPAVRAIAERDADYEIQVAQMVTARAKAMGHDSIVSEDGQHFTVFEQQDFNPVKRLDDYAASVGSPHGPVPRVFTKEAAQAMNDAHGGGASEARRAVNQILRKVAGQPLKTAERMAKREMAKHGVTLLEHQHAFEVDPIQAIANHASSMSHQIADRHLGNVARRLDALGWSKSAFASDAVGTARWRWTVGATASTERAADSLAAQHDVVARAEDRAAQLQSYIDDNSREAMAASQRLAQTHQAVQDLTNPEWTRQSIQMPEGPPIIPVGNAAAKEHPAEMAVYSAGAIKDQQLLRRYQQANDDIGAALNEVNKAKTKLHQLQAKPIAALMPAENALNMTGMERLDWLPGFEDMAAPSYIAQEMHWASRGFHDLNGFHKDWRKFMSAWKSWATFRWPGFHVRNFMGSYFNNMLGGVTLHDYHMANRLRLAAHNIEGRWAKEKILKHDPQFFADTKLRFINGVKAEDATYLDLSRHMGSIPGVKAADGRSFAEARVGAEALERALGKRDFGIAGQGMKQWDRLGRWAGTSVEDLARQSAMIRGLRDTGGDWASARAFTMMRHGDYADLTDWEYGFVRDMIPFYKWMRTNLPIQVHQLLESPGKLLAVNKARSAAWDAAGLNYDTDKYKVPDWMQQGFSAPIKGKDGALNLVMAQLPMNDLYTNGRTMMSSMLPFVLPFIENYVTKQKTFSGAPLTGEKTIPLNGNLNVLGPFLSHLGMADQNAKGTYDVSDTTVNMLNILPIFSRFQDWMYGDPKRVANRNFSVWSAVAGVTERPLNASTMTQAELDYYYLHVVPEVDQLRKQGYPVPTTQDLQGLGYTANQVLQGLGISPGAYSTAAGLNQGGPSTTTSNAAQAAPLSKSF